MSTGPQERGLALTPPQERPIRVRVTHCGVKLAIYHQTKPLPPFKVAIPHDQWEQLVALVRQMPAEFAFVGFTPEALALHKIDAVEAATL